MLGSLMIIEAESIEKARQFIEDDIYVESKVWESWEIYPYKAGKRLGSIQAYLFC